MRMRNFSTHRAVGIALRLLAVILACGLATPSAAAARVPVLPHLGASAAALTLMLAMAAGKPRD